MKGPLSSRSTEEGSARWGCHSPTQGRVTTASRRWRSESDRNLPANSQREPPDTRKKVSMLASGPSPGRTASRAHSPAAPESPPPLPPPGIFSPHLPAPLRRPGGRGRRARRALLTEPDSQPRSAAGTLGLRRDSSVRTAEPDWGEGPPARPATFRGKRVGGGRLRVHCRCHSPFHPQTTLTSARPAARALWRRRLKWQRGPGLLSQEIHMLMGQFPADSDAPWDVIL